MEEHLYGRGALRRRSATAETIRVVPGRGVGGSAAVLGGWPGGVPPPVNRRRDGAEPAGETPALLVILFRWRSPTAAPVPRAPRSAPPPAAATTSCPSLLRACSCGPRSRG